MEHNNVLQKHLEAALDSNVKLDTVLRCEFRRFVAGVCTIGAIVVECVVIIQIGTFAARR